MANEKLETERTSASRLQNDLRLQSELRNTQRANCRALQAYLVKEQQERQRLEEELLQSRRNCAELERLLSQSNEQAAQTKDETIREQMRQLEQERELKLGLEERVRRLPTEVDGKRIRRVSIGKFDCLKPRHCEDIKRIVGPTCFGTLQTLEKQAPHLCIYT